MRTTVALLDELAQNERIPTDARLRRCPTSLPWSRHDSFFRRSSAAERYRLARANPQSTSTWRSDALNQKWKIAQVLPDLRAPMRRRLKPENPLGRLAMAFHRLPTKRAGLAQVAAAVTKRRTMHWLSGRRCRRLRPSCRRRLNRPPAIDADRERWRCSERRCC